MIASPQILPIELTYVIITWWPKFLDFRSIYIGFEVIFVTLQIL